MILFILASAGLTWIVVKSHICRPARELISRITKNYSILKPLDEVLNCIGCFGTWSGALNYILVYKHIDWHIIPFAFASAITSSILISLLFLLNKR